MRDLAEIWANASHDIKNFSSWWKKIRTGILELEDSPQN
jgi:hypothetical protein